MTTDHESIEQARALDALLASMPELETLAQAAPSTTPSTTAMMKDQD